MKSVIQEVLSLGLSTNSHETRGFEGLSKSHLFCLSVWCLPVPVYCDLLCPAGCTYSTRVPDWHFQGGIGCEASVDLMETLMLYRTVSQTQ